ncbi:hypothetical protein KCP75_11885 [Salmonella enterica subsp. enterica]|nr:hypothetical protein KCP75_11885 [Salmonella enterica subsp. enterica]
MKVNRTAKEHKRALHAALRLVRRRSTMASTDRLNPPIAVTLAGNSGRGGVNRQAGHRVATSDNETHKTVLGWQFALARDAPGSQWPTSENVSKNKG